MKIPIQEKIAELERRIVALESRQEHTTTTTKTIITNANDIDLEPEWSGIWQSLDALFKKAFRAGGGGAG